MYGSAIGRGFATAIMFVIVVAVVITALIMGSIWYFTSSSEIKSEKRLTPTIELTTDGKTVDTLFIYKK